MPKKHTFTATILNGEWRNLCVKGFFATGITEIVERKSQNLCALCGFTHHSRHSPSTLAAHLFLL